MSIQIGAKPDSGFDDPIGMLTDCHRRIEHFLNILCVVVARAERRALTAEESEAIHAALQYFRVGGVRHTVDEEESLFPRIRAQLGSGTLQELARLEEDHAAAAGLHAAIETLYLKWIAESALDESDTEHLSSNSRSLKKLYEAHIHVEEKLVFPRAAQILESETVQAIGREFRTRRM